VKWQTNFSSRGDGLWFRGTSGIGRALVLGLAQAGADTVASSRKRSSIDVVTGEIEKLGVKTLAQTSDVREAASLQILLDKVLE
jgi:NAD(P)-dependent dehydrogenase (short-subunit alcohol dehydrogenase family)